MVRHIIIGDVHGNHLGVKKLLKSVHYNPNNDILVFVGDYNDHHFLPNYSTKKTIDLMIKLKKESSSVYYVLGNHDLWFREWLNKGGIPNPIWIKQGADETFKSYGIKSLNDAEGNIDKISKSHIEFYNNVIQDYYIDDSIIVIHGGFTNIGQMSSISNEQILEYEQVYQMVWDRRYIFTKLNKDKDIFEKYFNNRYLIVGHTPYGPYENNLNNKWLLVDGGSKSGKLQLGVIIENGDHLFITENTKI